MATGTVIGADLGGISLRDIGVGSALLSIPTFVYFAFVAVGIAHQLGMPNDLTAAVQNASGSHITMASPSRMALINSVCDITSQEKFLFRRMIYIAMVGLALVTGEFLICLVK